VTDAVGSQLRHCVMPPGECERLSAVIGKPVVAYVTAALTADGYVETIYPPGQNPCVTADIAKDSAHRLTCVGCDDCR
jgi:hypothetical protein